jgi:hypothetical protein
VSYHLRDRTLTDEDNQRLLNGLGAHDDQGHLMRFLEAPGTTAPEASITVPLTVPRLVWACAATARATIAASEYNPLCIAILPWTLLHRDACLPVAHLTQSHGYLIHGPTGANEEHEGDGIAGGHGVRRHSHIHL